MKVLYVTGNCLTRNTSANISHNAFVQGLLENGCEVDIIMAKDSWGERDQVLPVWKDANYFVFPSISIADRFRFKMREILPNQTKSDSINTVNNIATSNKKHRNVRNGIRSIAKQVFYCLIKPDPLYPLEKHWLKKASSFSNKMPYDLVISNSSPAASHRLVVELKNKGRIRFHRWIQVWEDPWSHDLYGSYPRTIEEEEHDLLRNASEIVYVSPLTLLYQKEFFQDCANKMSCIPLPAFQIGEGNNTRRSGEFSFGYFGDYYSETRNLVPFYEAIKESGYCCYIYGDSDLALKATDRIEISGRVTLDELQRVQDKTSVLVHLCNLRGGQIPGKIYHYSITEKPILFILDGTEKEQKSIKEYFEPFGRYYFCKNNPQDIRKMIDFISQDKKTFSGVDSFYPRNVARKLLQERDVGN